MKEFLIVLGLIIGVVIFSYILARLLSSAIVIKTKLAGADDKEILADQYYYLPGFSMTINANLTLIVSRSSTSREIRDVNQSLELEIQTKLEPDTDQLLILNYVKDFYSEDEIRIATSVDGLIENVSVVTDDRIDSIIAQLTAKVPQVQNEFVQRDFKVKGEETLVKESLSFTKTFKIPLKTLEKEMVSCRWIVTLDSPNSIPILWNASFSISNDSMKDSYKLASNFSFNGILSRPLQNKTWGVHFPEDPWQTDEKSDKFRDQPDNSFTAFVPDSTRITKVPIERNLFIKRTQAPKSSKGLLIENYFSKPSEMEALVSIPVNIAKAIFSIPSALLQFKVTNLKRELDFRKTDSELQKLTNPPPPAPVFSTPKSEVNFEDLQKQLKSLETALKDFKEKPTDYEVSLPKLGKLPADESAQPKSSLKDIQQDLFNKGEISEEAVTIVPEFCFWHSRFVGDWMSYNNEKVMNCVPAAAAHMIMCWTCSTKANTIRLTIQQVMAAYSRESGYDPTTGENDKGCATLSFLRNWKDPGMSLNKIKDFVGLRKSDPEELKLAISLFGACMIGFKMPNTAKDQKNTWEVTDPNNQLGEWGPHAVAAIGYDNNSLLIVSWGRLIQVKWDFYKKYNDEGFSVLTDDWFKDGKSPSGKDLATLEKLLENFA